eukprot:710063-Pelagomonas_calceolata.AAC.1
MIKASGFLLTNPIVKPNTFRALSKHYTATSPQRAYHFRTAKLSGARQASLKMDRGVNLSKKTSVHGRAIIVQSLNGTVHIKKRMNDAV